MPMTTSTSTPTTMPTTMPTTTTTTAEPRKLTRDEFLKKKRKQDMVDAGIGIGVALTGAAVLGSLLSRH